MTVRILSCAEQEFAEAVEYYNQQCPGLGYEFAAEVVKALERIRSFPDAWPALSARARRCLVWRFPYGVIYQSRRDEVLVLGIMHLRRRPSTWQDRLADTPAERPSPGDA